VLTDYERLLGNEHPDTLASRANLAASYWQAGRTNDAIEIEEHVLTDYERLLGNEHPDTLTSRSNLAALYWQAGRVVSALRLSVRILRTAVRRASRRPTVGSRPGRQPDRPRARLRS
ncbi:tetratricopeptide repeat protein, partial [Streptomyces sp. NPDC056255]|uniref:tetratricopeptide repeat protein n=1 Tax=Streptomyces sp. NPDC056255 TaxID=3345764 RepID=UPI0035D75966